MGLLVNSYKYILATSVLIYLTVTKHKKGNLFTLQEESRPQLLTARFARLKNVTASSDARAALNVPYTTRCNMTLCEFINSVKL